MRQAKWVHIMCITIGSICIGKAFDNVWLAVGIWLVGMGVIYET